MEFIEFKGPGGVSIPINRAGVVAFREHVKADNKAYGTEINVMGTWIVVRGSMAETRERLGAKVIPIPTPPGEGRPEEGTGKEEVGKEEVGKKHAAETARRAAEAAGV